VSASSPLPKSLRDRSFDNKGRPAAITAAPAMNESLKTLLGSLGAPAQFRFTIEPATIAGPDGEIGRRSGLKIRRPQGHGGSSPPPGTIESIP
jgi:hypothetical protein